MTAIPSDPTLSHVSATAGAAAARPGDETALEGEVTRLFDELRRPLHRYLTGFRLSVHDSEEVAQEVFLALFRHLRAVRPRENLRGWVFRVGHNLALKRLAAARDLQRYEAAAADRVTDGPSDPRPGPEDQLSQRQRRRRLVAVVAALPHRDQCCLRLRAEGLRYREIGEVLGMSLGAVALSLARSLARLSRADGA
jgi:RNA polymerase sigma-70 factor (ECF subfamily)